MKTRESRYVKVARIAYHLTQEALPRYSHPKSPHHFTLPQLAACVLLMFYLDLSYRDMEVRRLGRGAYSQPFWPLKSHPSTQQSNPASYSILSSTTNTPSEPPQSSAYNPIFTNRPKLE